MIWIVGSWFMSLVVTFVVGAKYGRWAQDKAFQLEQRIKNELLKDINKLP